MQDSAPQPAAARPRPALGRAKAVLQLVLAGMLAATVVWRESGRSDSPVTAFDDRLLRIIQKFLPGSVDGPLQLEARPDMDTRVFGPIPRHGMLPVLYGEFAAADRNVLTAWPPGPVDLAVAVQSLGAMKPPVLVLAQPPVWDDDAGNTLAGRTFASARDAHREIPVVVAAEPGSSAAPPAQARQVFAAWPGLAAAQVRGGAESIPVVNDPGPMSAQGLGLQPGDHGFSRLVLMERPSTVPGRVALPMLARAGDRFLLSLPLLAACRAAGVDHREIAVYPGKAILAGPLALPVDEACCLRLPTGYLNRVPTASLLDLAVPGREDGDPRPPAPAIVLGHDALPTVAASIPGNTGQWTAAALGAIRAGDYAQPVRVLRRAPPASTATLVAATILAAVISLWLPRGQRVAIAVAMLVLLAFATWHAAGSLGLFHAISIPLASSLACSILACLLLPLDHPTAAGQGSG